VRRIGKLDEFPVQGEFSAIGHPVRRYRIP
jgi:hypothetical protein